MPQEYIDKSTSYFDDARTEIEPLLAPYAERALEIGCGTGQTMRWLLETHRTKRAWGLELFEPAAQLSRKHFEEVLVGDAEVAIKTSFEGMKFDLILCLDVLEHMVDPWQFVQALENRLAPGGRLVVSLPNIRCLKVLAPLVLLGRWRYKTDGILDRTHLRFFTRETAVSLVNTKAFRFDRCIAHTEPGSKLELMNRFTLGLLEDFAAKQYLIASTRAA